MNLKLSNILTSCQASLFKRFRYFTGFLFLALLSGVAFAPAHAEEILLKNGSTLRGRLSGQDSMNIFVVTSGGSRVIPKVEVVRIQYVPFTPAEKAQALEARRAKDAASALEWERVRQIQEAQERKQREEELAAKIQAEKEADARAAAARAAALRELVARGQMEKPTDEPISYWDFAWRSLVLPGWGHFYLDRPWFGVLYAAGMTGFLATVYETHRRALIAVRENHREAERNFILSAQPSLPDLELRTAYGFYSNAKAITVYRHKLDQYNGSLVALATLYCVQLIHIIYNGIAWENGLLIVDNRRIEPGTIQTHFSVAPDFPELVKRPGAVFLGNLTMSF